MPALKHPAWVHLWVHLWVLPLVVVALNPLGRVTEMQLLLEEASESFVGRLASTMNESRSTSARKVEIKRGAHIAKVFQRLGQAVGIFLECFGICHNRLSLAVECVLLCLQSLGDSKCARSKYNF